MFLLVRSAGLAIKKANPIRIGQNLAKELYGREIRRRPSTRVEMSLGLLVKSVSS